jgi:hypothetical protein
MLVRRKAIDTTGGFDPKFFLYFEDYDWSVRLNKIGATAYLPAFRAVHHGGGAARKGWKHVGWFVRSAVLSIASTDGGLYEEPARHAMDAKHPAVSSSCHRRRRIRRRALVAQFVATGRPFVAVGRRPPRTRRNLRHVEVDDLATASDAALDAIVAGAAAIVHLAAARACLATPRRSCGALPRRQRYRDATRGGGRGARRRAAIRLREHDQGHGEETLPGGRSGRRSAGPAGCVRAQQGRRRTGACGVAAGTSSMRSCCGFR